MRKKIAVVIGTRPEAIKMAPVILELKRDPGNFEVVVISSGQHREMLDDPLLVFGISPNYDLGIMKTSQSLFDISLGIFSKIENILKAEKPDLVLIQGDTMTAFLAGVSSYYLKIPVGHVEAGLRTYDKYHPFPEELNRQLIDVISDFYFVPTSISKKNLLSEGKATSKIMVTGNTVIDAAIEVSRKVGKFSNKKLAKIDFEGRRVIFLECHRREAWGEKMEDIFRGVLDFVEKSKDSEVVFPVHLNPIVRKSARKILSGNPRVHLLSTLNYQDTILLLMKCFVVITDSGGLQEEAPVFDKPVLVLREVTERTEGVKTGALRVVGVDRKSIAGALGDLFDNKELYSKMAKAKNPFGDGKASIRIRKSLLGFLNGLHNSSGI